MPTSDRHEGLLPKTALYLTVFCSSAVSIVCQARKVRCRGAGLVRRRAHGGSASRLELIVAMRIPSHTRTLRDAHDRVWPTSRLKREYTTAKSCQRARLSFCESGRSATAEKSNVRQAGGRCQSSYLPRQYPCIAHLGERYPMCPMYPMTAESLLSLDSARPEHVPPPEIAYIGGDMSHSPTSTPDNLKFSIARTVRTWSATAKRSPSWPSTGRRTQCN